MNSRESADPQNILIADDQSDVREALRLLLTDQGYSTVPAESPEEVIDIVRKGGVSLALLDLNYTRDTTSGKEGLSLIERLKGIDPELPMVAMTAWGSVDLVVAAMQSGACDFIEKPWENTRLCTIVRTHLERSTAARGARRYRALARMQRDDHLIGEIVAESPGMRKVLELARRVAPSDAGVLITGENGTGKNLIAELIHRWSDRADEPFVSINMGSIPESLFESEMFGHVRGAFTDARETRSGRFELADGGTLFLDEVGNLPQAQQAKLLRVLESGRFERVGGTRTRSSNVRVVTATNADLQAMIAAGQFRRDLYFRLNTVEVHIPPLRERNEDIPALAQHFLGIQCRRQGRDAAFSDAALSALQAHRWPGNVRELAHTVERAVLLTGEKEIEPRDLFLAPDDSGATRAGEEVMPLADAERVLIRNALDRFGGNVQEAAQALGLSRSAMYRRLEKLGISLEQD